MRRLVRDCLLLSAITVIPLWMAGCPSSTSSQNPITMCTTSLQCAAGGTCDPAGFCAYPDAGSDGGIVDGGDAGIVDAGDAGPIDAGPIDAGPDAGVAAVSGIITADGGTVMASDGTAVSVPAGAIPGSATLTITPNSGAPAPAGVTVVGPYYTFGPEGETFTASVTVTLPYFASELPALATVSEIVIYTARAGSSAYTALTTSPFGSGHVQAQTNHFSVFVAGVPNPEDGGVSDAGDSGIEDAGDSGVSDAGDAGAADAGPVDAGPVDAGVADAGDAGSVTVSDAGTNDAGTSDAGTVDGGVFVDAGCSGCTAIVKGFRNPIDVKCHHGYGNQCFNTELALDYSGNSHGREKLVPIVKGQNWGFPCCATADQPYTGINPVPECSTVSQEADSFLIGNTPFGFDFVDTQFPSPWDHYVIVAMHGAAGSWSGAKLTAITTDPVTGLPMMGSDVTGTDTGGMIDFATGWDDSTFKHGRPSDVDMSPDGRLFISNDTNGEIFWIAPIGSATDGGPNNPFCQLSGSWLHDSSGWHVLGADPAGAADADGGFPDAGSSGHFQEIYPGDWLTIPEGFCAHHYTTVPNARQIRFATGGELFVASPTNGTTGGGAGGLAAIVVVPDDNGDGYGDSVIKFKTGLPNTQGMLFAQGSFYFQADQTPASAAMAGSCSNAKGTAVWKEPYVAGQRADNGNAQQVVDITYNCDSLHWPKTLDMSDTGVIYIGNGGSQSDTCSQPGGTAESMPIRGSIVQLVP